MINVLDKGYVKLLNLAGPYGKADDCDPARVARVSFNAHTAKPRAQDLKLVEYLWKHRHTTPFEMIETWWEMKLPIFVARQLVRHRTVSINEVSRRYVEGKLEFYEPAIWRGKAENKKQGSTDEPVALPDWFTAVEYITTRKYEYLLAAGVCPEQARIVLPVNLYTTWVWKQDLKNLLHMLSLRMAGNAQFETREYALAMNSILCDCLPELMRVTQGC